ncbi:MAG: hypothetical protein Q9221_006015 [Calogaya cf. arnoldii]
MALEINGCRQPDDDNEPQGTPRQTLFDHARPSSDDFSAAFSDDFLQQHAETNRKSLAFWYTTAYLPSNKGPITRQARIEMSEILGHVRGQHPLTRSDLSAETLAIISEWEKMPLLPGTAEFEHVRTRLVKEMAVQGTLHANAIASLEITFAELARARIWLYESNQGNIVAHHEALWRTPRSRSQLFFWPNGIDNVALPIETSTTATVIQSASDVPEQQAEEGTTQIESDHNGSSSSNSNEQNISHAGTQDTEGHGQAAAPLANIARKRETKSKIEESDEEDVFWESYENIVYQDGFAFVP